MEVSCLEEVRTVRPECAFINHMIYLFIILCLFIDYHYQLLSVLVTVYSRIGLLISLSFLQAEDLDLPEILKKKEEITETRNALFREISHEKKEYVCGDIFHLVLE